MSSQVITLHGTSTNLEDIRSVSLRHDAEEMNAGEIEWTYARYSVDGQPQWVDVLYAPGLDCAGIAWGADAVWTDASSLQDAIERYFGVDGKEVQ